MTTSSTTNPKEKQEPVVAATTVEHRIDLQARFAKFLAEGGAGRSNTNELLAAVIQELVAVGRVVASEEKQKKPASGK